MSYKIQYLPMADSDIEALAEYLSQFYPSTLVGTLAEMEKRIFGLQEHPQMYEEYANDPFYRRIVVSEYLVFYHVNERKKTVDIHRILRGSWDIEKYLPNKPE